MAEKLIGSLIYGEHEPPKKRRPWRERLKVPLTIGTLFLVLGGLAYKFANYREERQVRRFLAELSNKQFEVAYKNWDSDAHYTMDDFLADWGENGYYTKGMQKPRVIDSNSAGPVVLVYVQIDHSEPIALRVDKQTLKVSFSPFNKYK